MAGLKCSPYFNGITRTITVNDNIGLFKGFENDIIFDLNEGTEKITEKLKEGTKNWYVNIYTMEATYKGEREYVQCECNKECPHWRQCIEELGIDFPRGFHEEPAQEEDIIFNDYHLDYLGRKMVWKLNEKGGNNV